MTGLHHASAIFLFLPYVVFAGGWLQLPYAIAFGVLAMLAGAAGAGAFAAHRSDAPTDAPSLAWTLLPAIGVYLITGVGGWGYQDADWLRGNAVFRDLVQHPWPVAYETATEPLLLVYYIAFYLPAAAVGKLAGWEAANLALFVYGGIGISLAALWVTRLAGVARWWVVPLFLAFSGMDVIGTGLRSLFELASGDPEPRSWRYLEWWVGYGVACLPSHLNLLVFAPKQALPGWILTAMLLADARKGQLRSRAVFYLGVSTLWAPFVSIGLAPVVGVMLLRELRADRSLAPLVSLLNGLGLVIGLLSAAYFATRFHAYVLPIDVSHLHQEGFTLTLFRRGPAFLFLYPIFVVLEFALLHALLYAALWRDRSLLDEPLRWLFVTSTAALLFLPWINLGWNNDLVMRACIPMLFVSALVTIRVLASSTGDDVWRRRIAGGIVAVLAIGAINTAVIAGRHLEGIAKQGGLVHVPEESRVMDLFELQEQRYMEIGFNFVGQYMGSPESPIARALFAPPTPTR